MKEELFQLEIERQQGVITQEDYEKQKAALDQTLKRALARTAETTYEVSVLGASARLASSPTSVQRLLPFRRPAAP